MSFQLIQFWQIGLEFEIHVFWISFPTQSPICSMSFRTDKNLVCFGKFSVFGSMCFPGGASGKEPACQCRRHRRWGFHSWVGKIPWRREWQPTPVFLPGESHGQRSLPSYSPQGHKELDTTEVPKRTHTCARTYTRARARVCVCVCARSVLSDSLWSHGL